MPLTPIDAILYRSTDHAALSVFYGQAFQLGDPATHSEDHLGARAGNTYLGFELVGEAEASGVSVWFRVQDVGETYARLLSLGARERMAPDSECSPGETLAEVFDPAGNVIGLIGPPPKGDLATEDATEPVEFTATGGCRCGQVRYEARTKGFRSVVCGCADCQRASGSFLSVAVGVKADAFTIAEGEEHLKCFADTGDSGQPVRRYWCDHCGTPLFARPDSYSHIVSLRAITLDEPFVGTPLFGIFEANIPKWIHMPEVSFEDE